MHLLQRRGYMARNHTIVRATEELIATPKEYSEVIRSGTWSTIRHARKLKKRPTIIWPNGDVTVEAVE